MTLVRYKKHTEYSFMRWINHYPESNHPTDDENFYYFVKTVCKYNAKGWKNTDYLKRRILEIIPNFNSDKLENVIALYRRLLDFYKAQYLPSGLSIDPNARKVQDGYCIERWFAKEEFHEKEVPIDSLKQKETDCKSVPAKRKKKTARLIFRM